MRARATNVLLLSPDPSFCVPLTNYSANKLILALAQERWPDGWHKRRRLVTLSTSHTQTGIGWGWGQLDWTEAGAGRANTGVILVLRLLTNSKSNSHYTICIVSIYCISICIDSLAAVWLWLMKYHPHPSFLCQKRTVQEYSNKNIIKFCDPFKLITEHNEMMLRKLR